MPGETSRNPIDRSHDAAHSAPIFVVGMNGSGTSMLCDSLGRHPALYSFPGEMRMIPHLMDRAAEIGTLDDQAFHDLWTYTLNSSSDLRRLNVSETAPIPDNWRDYDHDLATILDTMFGQLAEAAGKRRWCEKSPNNTEHIGRIATLFPAAQFVHIIRDGRDCAASTHRRWRRTPALTIHRWRGTVSTAIAQGEALGPRYMQLRYEDLTNDPEPWMRRVCAHLHLDFDPEVLRSSMPQSARKADLAEGEAGRIEPNSMKWRSYFSDSELRQLERIAGTLLQSLDYPIVFEPGADDISWYTRNVQRTIDYLRANQALRGKLSGDKQYTWAEIFRRFRSAVLEAQAKRR